MNDVLLLYLLFDGCPGKMTVKKAPLADATYHDNWKHLNTHETGIIT
jgi:hypothetical protein